MKTRAKSAVAFVIIGVAVVLIGWLVAASSDTDQLTGPRVLTLVLLGAGITLFFVGQLIGEPAVTVDGAVSALLFIGLYLAAVFAADDDSDLASLDNEILIGVLLAGTVFALDGLRNLANAVIRQRRPSPELIAIAALSGQINDLEQRLDQLQTAAPLPHAQQDSTDSDMRQGAALRHHIRGLLRAVAGRL